MQEAQAAKQHTQGYNLDKRHAFKVTMFDEFDKYLKISDGYEELESKDYAPTENLQVGTCTIPVSYWDCERQVQLSSAMRHLSTAASCFASCAFLIHAR